jgi:hypothetical protein
MARSRYNGRRLSPPRINSNSGGRVEEPAPMTPGSFEKELTHDDKTTVKSVGSEDTKTYSPEQTPVPDAKPVNLVYYAVPISEQKHMNFELEVSSPNALPAEDKFPKGIWGYRIISRQKIPEDDGTFKFKHVSVCSQTIYARAVYERLQIQEELGVLRQSYEQISAQIKKLESIKRAMDEKGLERLVEVEGGTKVSVKDSNARILKKEERQMNELGNQLADFSKKHGTGPMVK